MTKQFQSGDVPVMCLAIGSKWGATDMDIVGAIAGVTQGITVAKALRSIERTYDDATYKSQIADLLNALTDARIALADARDKISEQDKEIERLKAAFASRSDLVSGDGGYNFLSSANGQPVGYPVCPKCEEKNGRIVQTKQDGPYHSSKCPLCDTKYGPVTCYLQEGPDKTLAGRVKRIRAEASAADTARIRARRSSWMG